MAVKVSEKVLEGLKFVRDSGLTNMFDFHAVQRIANDEEFHETVVWMEDHRREYAQGITEGFELDEC